MLQIKNALISCVFLLVWISRTGGQETVPTTLDLLRTFRSEFVDITPGKGTFPKEFSMGNKSQSRRVVFGYNFAVAKYEVPQNLWQAVMGTNPSRWKGERNSVEMLSLAEARTFCKRVTSLLRNAKMIDPSQVVRLPSEAEWEYFARAGTTTDFSFGNSKADLREYGWFTGNAAGNDPAVGEKKPNPWGLYDIHGYLWEWCEDSWHDSLADAPKDGSAWTAGGSQQHGVQRGGSWKDAAALCFSSYRNKAEITQKDDAVGLRCVLATESI